MLYVLFFFMAHLYNVRKFFRERDSFISSIVFAQEKNHREMILGHHFHVYIFETFLSIMVAHFISEGGLELNLAGVGAIYLALIGIGFGIYQSFLRFLEKSTQLSLRQSFNQYVFKEFRVSFALLMLPMLLYSIIHWAFLDEAQSDWGDYWLIGFISNFLFVSVVTILCTVVIMLRLIPNREITETEYLEIINKHLNKIGMSSMRVRWIESDIKNAFVVGLRILNFSNQTMFVGKRLRTMLTLEEFDSIIAHEISHVANRHIQKRIMELLKNFAFGIVGAMVIFGISFLVFALYYWEDAVLHMPVVGALIFVFMMSWFLINYALFFDTIRSHEYEADAYAVLVLGANADAYKSALEKLTKNDMPDYLKSKIKTSSKKNWIVSIFSTHPEIQERMVSLELKMANKLPFDYYISPARKLRNFLSKLFHWRVALPIGLAVVVFLSTTIFKINNGSRLAKKINTLSRDEIMTDNELRENINKRPMLVGPTLMAEIVKKKDPVLLDYFLKNGANKAQTLFYLSELKDLELFRKYFENFQTDLTEDEYFIVMSNTARSNFTEGYRLMVNSNRFNHLNQDYKSDLTKIHSKSRTERKPASLEK